MRPQEFKRSFIKISINGRKLMGLSWKLETELAKSQHVRMTYKTDMERIP